MYDWDMHLSGDDISVDPTYWLKYESVDLAHDECLYAIDEPINNGSERRRESLRRTKSGTLYVHCVNDCEPEKFYFNPDMVQFWAEGYEVKI